MNNAATPCPVGVRPGDQVTVHSRRTLPNGEQRLFTRPGIVVPSLARPADGQHVVVRVLRNELDEPPYEDGRDTRVCVVCPAHRAAATFELLQVATDVAVPDGPLASVADQVPFFMGFLERTVQVGLRSIEERLAPLAEMRDSLQLMGGSMVSLCAPEIQATLESTLVVPPGDPLPSISAAAAVLGTPEPDPDRHAAEQELAAAAQQDGQRADRELAEAQREAGPSVDVQRANGA